MTVPDAGRPLSPHLSVYRWSLTMTVSILHRASGIALSCGLLLLAGWLVAAAAGPAAYGDFVALLGRAGGRLLLAALSLAFFFHLANGVRHLFWDAGLGFEKSQANASARAVVAATVVLTLGYWLLLQMRGLG